MRHRYLPVVVLIASAMPMADAAAQTLHSAQQLFESGSYAEAKAQLVALQTADSRNGAIPWYLGRIATIANEGDEAVRHFTRAVELDDRNAAYHTSLGNAIREVTPYVSKFKMPFNARRMRIEWERAVELDPDQIDARFGLVQYGMMAPRAWGGSKDKARAHAAEIARRNPMRGAMALAVIEQEDKNIPAEEAAYRSAITAASDSSAGYFALAFQYAGSGKTAEAFELLNRYASSRPDDQWTDYHAGRIAARTGDSVERGESALIRFLSKPPLHTPVVSIARAHYWLGQIAERRGAKDIARERYHAAIKIDPRSQAKRALEALK